MDIIGYVLAAIIGVVLGVVGGGGSILTLPVLVYVLGFSPIMGTAYSLFIVGFTALTGAIQSSRQKLVSYKVAFVFSIPAFISVYATRRYILPSIPEKLLEINDFVLSKDMGIMIFFALIMLLAAYSMIKPKTIENTSESVEIKFNYPMILIEGSIVGVLTGLVGAGGGFLIIPALVMFAKMPMKMAVGTSLLIISIKSLIGFLGDIEMLPIDWRFLLTFTGFSVLGIFLGLWLARYIPGHRLRGIFGWFILLMAIVIIFKEL